MRTVDEVRAQFPNAVAIADQFREVFGDGVKLVYAEEGGKSIGYKNPEKGTWITPSVQYKKKARSDD